jgi:hypothetical protein
VGKFSLATILCTWSPNEVARLLSVIIFPTTIDMLALAPHHSPLGIDTSNGKLNNDHVTYCKDKLPLSVFLVINDNPYGLMFSLSYEGIIHRNCLKSMCWIQGLDAMKIKIYLKYWHQDH